MTKLANFKVSSWIIHARMNIIFENIPVHTSEYTKYAEDTHEFNS